MAVVTLLDACLIVVHICALSSISTNIPYANWRGRGLISCGGGRELASQLINPPTTLSYKSQSSMGLGDVISAASSSPKVGRKILPLYMSYCPGPRV